MVELSTNDQQRLILILQDMPEFATEQSRRLMLELAGLKQLAPRIRLDGAQFIAVSAIVSYLANFGRLTYDHEALGLLLNAVKKFVGVKDQEFLDELLLKYQLMTPIAPTPAMLDWRGTDTPSSVTEKIIGENTLRPIAFLTQGLAVARSVVYVGVNAGVERWSGTGFLVASDLLLTNQHVISNAKLLHGAYFRFNYEENFLGQAQPIAEFSARPDGLFHANEALDYAVIEVAGEPGKTWGWLPLLAVSVRRGERVNIIQHPSGRPKQISLQNNFVEYVGSNVVQYITATEPGSSGSPVFNDGWQVVALHHAGGNLREPTTNHTYFRNEGIAIDSILGDLPPVLRTRIESASETA